MKYDLKAKFLGFFSNNWQLKLISLLLAVVLWFVICEYVDPETDTPVSNIKITMEYEGSVPQKEGLGIMTAIDETVSIRVSGSRDAVALMDHQKITASLDLSNVTRSGEYDLPVKINLGNQNLKLEEQSIESIKVQFDTNIVSNVKINVKVKGAVQEGYIREEPKMLNNYINVTGPKAIVETIVSAEVEIEQETFLETSTFNCAYKFLDKNGKEIPKTFLTTDVPTVDVTVAVVKEKTVPMTVTIVNSSGGSDQAFCIAKVQPETIKITGNEETLNAINAIDLGVIDVAENTKDFETTVPVVLPNGVNNVKNIETAKVTVKFNDIQTRTIRVNNINLQNVPKGTDAKVSEKSISIKVRGISEDINRLNAEDIKVVVDANDQILPAGTNRMNALVVFPKDYKVGAVGKYQLTVVVS